MHASCTERNAPQRGTARCHSGRDPPGRSGHCHLSCMLAVRNGTTAALNSSSDARLSISSNTLLYKNLYQVCSDGTVCRNFSCKLFPPRARNTSSLCGSRTKAASARSRTDFFTLGAIPSTRSEQNGDKGYAGRYRAHVTRHARGTYQVLLP